MILLSALAGLVVGIAICLPFVLLRAAALRRSEEEVASRTGKLRVDEQRVREGLERIKARGAELADRVAVAARIDEVLSENMTLKATLRTQDLDVRAEAALRVQTVANQEALDQRTSLLATRFLKESRATLEKSLTTENYSNRKTKLLKVIEWCRDVGFDISGSEENEILQALADRYELVLRAASEREEQARIKARIREERAREKEIEEEQRRLEAERVAIEQALAEATARLQDEHADEVERLREQLREAEEKSQRALSMAQQTWAGHVYVISNIGSFGEGVFKIGMTRRLEPLDRVKELSDASVPFPFDVHMMISSEDAPKLERDLHEHFASVRVNRVNLRKEFFRADVHEIARVAEDSVGASLEYRADAEALEYLQSLETSDEQLAEVKSLYERSGVGLEDASDE